MVQPAGRIGAREHLMRPEENPRRFGAWYLAALLCAALFLNIDAIHYHPVTAWAKTVPVILILAGAVGSVKKIPVLRLVGWLGIAMFALISVGISFPTEDYRLGGPDGDLAQVPRETPASLIAAKLAAAALITMTLSWFHRKKNR